MDGIDIPETPDTNKCESYYTLLSAFKIIKGNCQQLQARLAAVEAENVHLRLQCGKGTDDQTGLENIKGKVEELTKQKTQLTQHVLMIAAENQQLRNRLTKLTRTNKTLGSELHNISDTLKQRANSQKVENGKQNVNDKDILSISNGDDEQSLEEISLKLINSIMLGKSDLEEQYAQMVELQNTSDLNLQNIGFGYPDSQEQLKQHDIRLSQTKDALLAQQNKLKRLIENLKSVKNGTSCQHCNRKAKKKMCQAGTQFDSDDSFREHRATQTSPPPLNLTSEQSNDIDNGDTLYDICPLCGKFYKKSIPFAEFHEHVLSHFDNEPRTENYELVH